MTTPKHSPALITQNSTSHNPSALHLHGRTVPTLSFPRFHIKQRCIQSHSLSVMQSVLCIALVLYDLSSCLYTCVCFAVYYQCLFSFYDSCLNSSYLLISTFPTITVFCPVCMVYCLPGLRLIFPDTDFGLYIPGTTDLV